MHIIVPFVQISHNVQSPQRHACWCNKKIIVWLCVCTVDNCRIVDDCKTTSLQPMMFKGLAKASYSVLSRRYMYI